MKSKVLVSSILTIALCLSLIAGSTFALFTDQSKFGIEVTSGDVEIYAHAGIAAVWSAEGAVDDVAEDFYLQDENGHGYVHVEQTTSYDRANGEIVKGVFANGGDAIIDGSKLTLNRVTPGDRVDVTINVENKSNVAMVYRYKLIADESNLAYGMVVSVGDNTTDPTVAPTLEAYEGLATWTSKWYPVIPAANGTPSAIPDYTFSIELPVYAGNEYQSEYAGNQYYDAAGNELTYAADEIQSVSYTVLVEAVQGNAVTDDESVVTVFPEAAARSLEYALNNPNVTDVKITEEMMEALGTNSFTFSNVANKTFDFDNAEAFVKFTGNVDNVVVANVEYGAHTKAIKLDVSGATGNITVKDSTFYASDKTYGMAIKSGANVDITVDNCNFVGTSGSDSYALYGFSAADVVFTDCTFEDMGSWVYMLNGSQQGDLVIDGCTFNNCAEGLFKSGVKGQAGTTGTVGGNFVFTNNTITNCAGHDGSDAKWFTVKYEGTLTFENNTKDGAAWNVADYTAIGLTDTNP